MLVSVLSEVTNTEGNKSKRVTLDVHWYIFKTGAARRWFQCPHWNNNRVRWFYHCFYHLSFWCCKMELNLRAKLQQDKVGGFLDHLNFCLCFLVVVLATCGCWVLLQHCSVKRLEPITHQKDVPSTPTLFRGEWVSIETRPLVVNRKEIRPSQWIFTACRTSKLLALYSSMT